MKFNTVFIVELLKNVVFYESFDIIFLIITYKAMKMTSSKDVCFRERMVGGNSHRTLVNSPWSCSCETLVMAAVFLALKEWRGKTGFLSYN